MPNKLTDAEVKKALECYREQKMFAFNGKKPEIYIHDIIDLINRQEAEIKHLDIESDILRADVENLNRICDELNAENESLKAEVERLNNNISAMATTLSTSARATRHEAYKECIEKVKAHYKECQFEYDYSNTCETLNNIYKELVGEDNSHNIDKQN